MWFICKVTNDKVFQRLDREAPYIINHGGNESSTWQEIQKEPNSPGNFFVSVC